MIPLGILAASGSTGAMELIATGSGTGSSATLTFSNIPQNFTHLQLRAVVRTATNANTDTAFAFNFNNDTNSTNSAFHRLYGTGSTVISGNSTGNSSSILGFVPANTATANAHGAIILDILDYRSTTKLKTLRSFYGMTGTNQPEVGLVSNLPVDRPGLNAITSMSIIFNSNITTSSRFSLYGIRG